MNTAKTAVKTFTSFDQLALKTFADGLLQYLIVDYQYVEGNLVISLNGRFGCGKSCFLAMFKHYLEQQQYNVIHINAWQNDFLHEPIIVILAELLAYIENGNFAAEKALKNAILPVIGFMTKQHISHSLSVNIKQLLNRFTKDKADRGEKFLQEYKEKIALFSSLNNCLRKYLAPNPTRKTPFILLIDELDRARPDYVVNFLETIKHFFQAHGLVFVLAVDQSQLESSVKCLYGSEINFAEYYRKFVHRNINFPDTDKQVVEQYIRSRVEEHFSQHKGLLFVTELHKDNQQNLVELCVRFKLSPRQTNELFRTLSHYLSINKEGQKTQIGQVVAAMIYITLTLTHKEAISSIDRGTYTYVEALNLFKQHQFENLRWWALLLLYATSTQHNYPEHRSKYIKEFTMGEAEVKQRFKECFGYSSEIESDSILQKIAKSITVCKTMYDV